MTPKKWYMSKQLWVAIITGVLGVLGAVVKVYPEASWTLIINSVLLSVLRILTDSPITFKNDGNDQNGSTGN